MKKIFMRIISNNMKRFVTSVGLIKSVILTAIYSNLISTGSATHCPIGSTVVIGSQKQDGNTIINTWGEVPISGASSLIIGATTFSKTVAEKGNCDLGCAIIAGWSRLDEHFFGKLVYTQMRSVLAISSNTETFRTAILFSRVKADQTKATGIGFLKWSKHISTGKP